MSSGPPPPPNPVVFGAMHPSAVSTVDESVAPSRARHSVSIIIANFNGERDLPACLDSIKELEYPADLVETIIVENGSSDGSVSLLAERYAWAKVLPQTSNLGFAPAVNLGVEAATGELVVLLNNDMQVEPGWLEALVAAYDPEQGYTCVAGTILDWDGEKIDYAEGVLNWHGMGDQIGFGLPVDQVSIQDGRELLFACGGAMLISREVYLEVGGLDANYFAYFEDVDLGWRLWLSGHKVRLAAGARCRHRHNGTSGRFPFYQRALLYERNAMRTLIKNLDDENLGRMLGPALLLLIQRALGDAKSERSAFDFGAKGVDDATDQVPRAALARLHGIGDIIENLDELMRLRREVQLRRQVSDAEVLARFGRPFRPLGAGDESYLHAAESVRRHFRIEEAFEKVQATRVVVLAYDAIGEKMAGPSVRSWEIAKALARISPVTLVSTSPIGREAPGVTNLQISGDDEELRQILLESDAVLVHGYAFEQFPSLKSSRALLVVDLYDPWIFENLEMHYGSEDDRVGDFHNRRDVDVQTELLDHGDFFICASERQRDYWLGMLTARGRVDRAVYQSDRSLRSLIDVLPYGCPEEKPKPSKPVLKGVHPSVGTDDLVITWGGGTWEWFDPVMVLEAFAKAHAMEPRLRLFFMGLDQASGTGVPRMKVAQRLRERADELGMTDKSVIFGNWAPYDERGAYLVESDMGVIATKDLAEVRLAFRSRLLDHFWTGLPTIATEGDVLADVVKENNAGIVVPIGDEDALAAAMVQLGSDTELRKRQAANAARLGEEYRWTRSVEVLRPLVDNPSRWQAIRSLRPRSRQLDLREDTQVLLLRRRGMINAYARYARLFERLKRSRFKPVLKWGYERLRAFKRLLRRS